MESSLLCVKERMVKKIMGNDWSLFCGKKNLVYKRDKRNKGCLERA